MSSRTVNGGYPNHQRGLSSSYFEKDVRLLMSREEYYAWCDRHAEEILSLFQKGLRPSIDRIDGKGGYSPDNVQILPLKENIAKKTLKTRALKATCTTTGVITFYPSFAAAKKDGHSKSGIYRCIAGELESYRGFKWKRLKTSTATRMFGPHVL